MADDLTETLQRLHVDAGRPSSRKIAARAGISHSAVAEILRGSKRFRPTWATVDAIVAALGGDRELFGVLWRQEYEADLQRHIDSGMPPRMPTTVVEELREIRSLLERVVDLMERTSVG